MKSNLPCQDAHGVNVIKDDFFIVAVADGLGSAPRSDIGAKLAVNAAVSGVVAAIEENPPEDEEDWVEIVRKGFRAARSKLEEQTLTNNLMLRDYSTTLILSILTNDWLATGHIGDGANVALMENGNISTVSPPQRGEFVNQTFPITLPNALEIAYYSAMQIEVNALAIFSDGLQNLSIRNVENKPHYPFFAPLFKQLSDINDSVAASKSLAEFLASDRVCSKTDDDKTLILIGKKFFTN